MMEVGCDMMNIYVLIHDDSDEVLLKVLSDSISTISSNS
jgi:hypothetical protein